MRDDIMRMAAICGALAQRLGGEVTLTDEEIEAAGAGVCVVVDGPAAGSTTLVAHFPTKEAAEPYIQAAQARNRAATAAKAG